jgi:hypothetical protein
MINVDASLPPCALVNDDIGLIKFLLSVADIRSHAQMHNDHAFLSPEHELK